MGVGGGGANKFRTSKKIIVIKNEKIKKREKISNKKSLKDSKKIRKGNLKNMLHPSRAYIDQNLLL